MSHKLLLADDSVTIQRVIELTFADEDIQVVAVGDGQQAIERIEAERPDVVLADVGMPERDGYEVAAFVKRTPHLAHIPVLLLTGAFEPVDEGRARAAGCDGVLVKPFEPQMVINRVKDLLAGRRPESLWATPPTPSTPPVRPASGARGSAPDPQKPPAGPAAAAAAAGGSQAADSLDDYFDRLDAAFGELGAAQPAEAAPAPRDRMRPLEPDAPPAEPLPSAALDTLDPGSPVAASADDGLGGWDPGVGGDEPIPAAPAPAPAAPVQPDGGWLSEARRAVPSDRPAVPVEPLRPAKAAPEGAPAPLPSLSDAFEALLAAEQGHMAPPGAAAPITDGTIDLVVQKVVERLTTAAVRETVVDVAERLVREEIARIKNAAH